MNPPVLVAGAAIAALSISTVVLAAEDAFVVPAWPYPGNPPSSIAATPPVYACGYCHLPDGQGRPENAPLAGLPATYIRSQVADFRRGARRSAWHGTYLPTDFMRSSAENATDEEIAAAASYFSALPMTRRVQVIEAIQIPKTREIGWLYVPIEGDGTEPLGLRIIEVPLNHERHELRDSRMAYRAYVPAGSVKRGRDIADNGDGGPDLACTSCHGQRLRGMGPAPPLAGRSPTYIVRQLLAFKTGERATAAGGPMIPVVEQLDVEDVIAAAAYAASLEP